MDVKSCKADDIFRVFTRCERDLPTLLLDLRPHKEYARSHVAGAFCNRLSKNEAALLVRCNSSKGRAMQGWAG